MYFLEAEGSGHEGFGSSGGCEVGRTSQAAPVGLGGTVKMWGGLFGATRVPSAQPASHMELEHLGTWLGTALLLHP